MHVSPLDLGQLKVFPLAQRKTLTRADDILIDPDAPAKACSEATAAAIAQMRAAISRRPASATPRSC